LQRNNAQESMYVCVCVRERERGKEREREREKKKEREREEREREKKERERERDDWCCCCCFDCPCVLTTNIFDFCDDDNIKTCTASSWEVETYVSCQNGQQTVNNSIYLSHVLLPNSVFNLFWYILKREVTFYLIC